MIDKELSEQQELLFKRIKQLGVNVGNLDRFVQNDFGRMLVDGTVTHEYLDNELRDEVGVEFEKLIDELMLCKHHVITTINQHLITG